MGTFSQFIETHWRHVLLWVSVGIVGYFLLFFGMRTLVPGFSANEIATQGSATSLSAIWHDPLNAPYKLALWVPFKLGHHSVLWTRALSASIAFLSGLLFYFILQALFSRRIALFGVVLFVISAGFLHAGRLGTPLIMQLFGVLVLMSLLPLYLTIQGRIWPLYVGVAVIGGLLYVPGMPWFIIISGLIMAKRIIKAYRKLSLKHRVLLVALATALIAPLVWGVIRTPSMALTLLGLPASLPGLQSIGQNASDLVRSLFWSATGPAEIMLVGAPLFTIAEFALLAVGLIMLTRDIRLKSNLFLIGSTILIALLIVAGGSMTYVALTPLLYLCMASGIFYLLREWLKVFPVTPLANTVGTMLVFLLVLSASLFHFRAYFIAWPHSDGVAKTFVHPQPASYDTVPGNTANDVKF